ncbi:MAG: DNA topoisomerase (ATP-hydrolyzing) subunit B [Candidatus Thermoplasmatota archaeon]|nr:DNA topoisomerase (ATP-hydrolyzing) subunit B [Candidatus Thermoplasmatota archaeon]MCL5962963.1 DNA topoisomerase (ATP-hydrolyzing) subunit B [Candidatus Thermoplasmatota archaeon]
MEIKSEFDKNSSYTAKDIKVLEGLEPVRKRPSMYIGSTDERGLHHLINEVVDNCIDEAMAGYCTNIEIIIHTDGSISISDNGRGIPVDIHEKYGKPAVEVVMTILHSGGKFDKNVYKVSGGLHGVGIHVVNALSEWLEVMIKRNGKVYIQRYETGKPANELTVIGEATGTGTNIRFKPDNTIFETVKFSYETIINRARELSFLHPYIAIHVKDERSNKEEVFHHEGGIVELVDYLTTGNVPLHKPIYINGSREECVVEIAMKYVTDRESEEILSFVNSINTVDGGTHVTGFRSSLTKTFISYGIKNKIFKESDGISGEDVRNGLTAVISTKVIDPQFEGQTKAKLGNSAVRGVVESITSEMLYTYMEEHPADATKILNKIKINFEVREAVKRAKEQELAKRKSLLEGTLLPWKLADCSERDPSKTELFIVEGDSAGGSAKQGRMRSFQAILPLKGKILNIEKATADRIFNSDEIKALISTIGTSTQETFDISKLRYNRIIIMTDADVDGSHIITLLLTFFFRYMKPLVENGHIFIAQPPLYRISKGKETVYCYSDDEKNQQVAKYGDNVAIQRYKGLGEMNPHQLWETTMDPAKRLIIKMVIEDAIEADRLFSILMGSKVDERRKYIEEHASEVRNLDV